jgi:serine/threonine protein kinase
MELNDLVNHRYIVEELIGNGSFGNVYSATCQKKNTQFAIKTEDVRSPYKILKHECSILKYLYDNRCRSIPIISWYGLHNRVFCLVTPLYDMNLNEYLQTHDELPLPTVYKLFQKLISLVQSIHELHVLHRDIKPDNFMIKNGELFLIDFGLSCFCIDDQSNHLENIQLTEITGNIKYCSYYVMLGNRPSIRDDVISLGYMFLYILYQELPWDNVPHIEDTLHPTNHISNRRTLKIASYKEYQSIKLFPMIDKKLIMYFQYSYNICYDESPCYNALRTLFT